MEAPNKPSSGVDMNHPLPPQSPPRPSPLWKMILVSSMAVGLQFGWGLQISLLTPYAQILGVPAVWTSFIWFCGPISGMLVQPTVGYYSDRCTSRFGRRRPFIAAGTALLVIAVFLIGYAADIGRASGDPDHVPKPRAIGVYVVGFWILDVATNTLQGPCRAFLADLAAEDQSKTRIAFASFSFFMAVGNVLGFAAASYNGLYRVFPFSHTAACDVNCAHVKSCFFIHITVLISLTAVVSFCVHENPLSKTKDISKDSDVAGGACGRLPFFREILDALKHLKRPMWILMLVTSLTWVAWFPLIVNGTDWMGKEVYGGKVHERSYDRGVRKGAFGLMLQSVVLGVVSLAIEPLSRLLGGAKRLWGIVNLVLALCLAMMLVISKMAEHVRHLAVLNGATVTTPPPANILAAALALLSLMGIPLAITYSVPFALASIFSASTGAGQGLALGVLNLAIVSAQLFVAATSGHWDALFGGGNLPSFAAGAVSAAISALLAFTILPSPPPDVKLSGIAGGH